MPVLLLSKPGDEFGPCEKPCHHDDCKAMNEEAELRCRYCDLRIGFQNEFFREPGGIVIHLICAERESAERRKAK